MRLVTTYNMIELRSRQARSTTNAFKSKIDAAISRFFSTQRPRLYELQKESLLAGRYQIKSAPIRTSMGRGYNAVDIGDRREVFIKTPSPDCMDSCDCIKDFIRGAVISGEMNQKNIVKVLALGFEHEFPFIVMEKLE